MDKDTQMTDREKFGQLLFTAELQFRLASAVRLAVTQEIQPLDLPMEWTHGRHQVTYEEIALREDQAEYAACYLHRSSTYLLAVAIKDAIRAVVSDPKRCTDSDVRAAYQIARLIRNAFAHAPFKPIWSIDPDCRNKVFSIPDIISLDTTDLHGTTFDWHQYGGPLALFRLCRFVRTQIVKDEPLPRTFVPLPQKKIYQQGNLILTAVDEIPPDAVRVEVERLSDGGIPLGDSENSAEQQAQTPERR
jgi:hypothetical protein